LVENTIFVLLKTLIKITLICPPLDLEQSMKH
jgi:hypothetical protein